MCSLKGSVAKLWLRSRAPTPLQSVESGALSIDLDTAFESRAEDPLLENQILFFEVRKRQFLYTDVFGINTAVACDVQHQKRENHIGAQNLKGTWSGSIRFVESWRMKAGGFWLSGSAKPDLETNWVACWIVS